ncbi:MAG: tetratricopeptide repeat protein [Vicinamibacteraceae bacterium]|nr:tetratricopeptide repeat protein [Vicinamibacteraceae bacterium]
MGDTVSTPKTRAGILLLAALAAFTVPGCAARGGRPSAIRDALAEGARLEAEGCYQCLLRADHLYAQALESEPRHEALTHRRSLVQILIRLRALEIGVAAGPASDEAGSQGQRHEGEVALRDAVALVMPHPSLWATPDFAAIQARAKVASQILRPLLASLETTGADPAVKYVDAALRCAHGDSVSAPAWLEGDEATPLLVWKRATCGELDAVRLEVLEARAPDWVEASYLLAVTDLRQGRVDQAFERLSPVADRLPGWAAAWMTLGNLHLAREEYDEAVHRFEQVVGQVPGHREALAGALVAESYANRHERAIAVADTMIALGMYRMADAWFWRAWNLARLSRYHEAADSIEHARTMMTSAEFHKLAALVERTRGQLGEARRDIERALQLAPDDCDARAESGAIELTAQRWPSAAHELSLAHACYDSELDRLASVPEPAASDLDRRRRERQVADARRGRARASLGAAQAYVQIGRLEEARAVLSSALEHAETAAAARELLERVAAR